MKYLVIITSLALGIGNNALAQWELLAPLDTVPYNVYCKFFNDSTGVVCSGGYDPDLLLLKTWDYGETWDTIYTNDGFFTDIDFTDEMTGYLCTYLGPILKTTDGGYTWTNVNSDSSLVFTFQNMFFLNENVGFGTVYTGGGVWRTIDGGVHWENLPNSGWGYSIFATNICNIYVSDPNYLIKSNNCDPNWPSYPYQSNDINLFEARSIFMLDDQIGFQCQWK
jgi:photosystem II stability/assembly factor-like uncharacterized protein